MKARRILVPVDFSPYSESALQTAAKIARDSGGTLIIVHVEEIPTPAEGLGYLYPVPEGALQDVERHLKSIVPDVAGVPYEHRLLKGPVADSILAAAEQEKADLIVIGSHGLRGITRLLLGSVAETIVRKAGCAVLTVKSQPAKAAASDA